MSFVRDLQQIHLTEYPTHVNLNESAPFLRSQIGVKLFPAYSTDGFPDSLMHFISHRSLFGILFATLLLNTAGSSCLSAQERQYQFFKMEFFYDSSDDASAAQKEAFDKYAEQRPGLKLFYRDIHENEKSQKRLKELEDYFGLKERKLPAIYGLKYFITDIETDAKLKKKLDNVLTLTAYVRNGCPHCRDAKAFLGKYNSRYPALKIVYKEVISNRAYNNEMYEVVRRYRQGAASLPVVHYCNGVTIGFNTESTTGRRILQTLDYWSEAGTLEQKKKN